MPLRDEVASLNPHESRLDFKLFLAGGLAIGEFMWKSVGLMAFLLVFLGYWVYHLTNGPRSIFVRGQIIQERGPLVK